MSYNTKYILSYCNRLGKSLRVEIQLWDYVGETFILVNQTDYLQDQEGAYVTSNIDGEYDPERDKNLIEGGSNPFTLNYQNDTSEKGGAIRATFADMEFFEDMLFNIDDLATSDETEIRAVFYYDNKLEWIGFVTPDFFNVEITENPLIRLTASDRVGVLKDVDYPILSEMTDKVRILDIITNILKETGLVLNINVVCGLYSDQFEPKTGDAEFEAWEKNNPLYDTWVNEYRLATDLETLETTNCYEVLQRVMNQFNCLITQYKGEWWIVNKFDLDNGKGVRFIYTFDGLFQSMDRIIFSEEYFSLIDTGGERTLIPAGAKNTYLLDHGIDMIYPLNHSLNSGNISLDSIKYWNRRTASSLSEMSQDIPAVYSVNGNIQETYSNEIRELVIKDFNITVLSNDTTNYTPYPSLVNGSAWLLSSEKFDVVTLDKKKSSFKLTVEGVGRPNTALMIGIFMEIEEEGIPGVKHYFSLRNEVSEDGKSFKNRYAFIPISNLLDASLTVLPVGFENKFNSSQIPVDNKFEISLDIAKGSHQAYDINTAKLFVRVYPSGAYKKNDYNQNLEYIYNVLKSIKVEFINDNQTPKGTVFQSKINGKFTKPTEQRDVLYGDYQTVGQNGFFYKYREDSLSIQYNSAGERLKDWFTPYDSERNPLLVHSLRQLTYSYGKAHDELRIGFDMDRINPFSHFAVRCFSERYIQVNPEDDYLQEKDSKYITTTIGKYLNSKRFVLVEGKIDYLRSHFEGVLAQIRTNEVQRQEYIYSYFEQGDIS